MRLRVIVLSMLAVMVLFTTGASSQVATISQPGTIIGSVELMQNNVDMDTDVDIYTVPAGVRFKITDLIVANSGASANCCARIFTGPANPGKTNARTGFITVPSGDSVDHSFLNGINFASGQVVTVRNDGADGQLHFTVRGYLFTIP